ncbi:hypothetical protein [Streptomyces shenzhenensis]|uniref:hypothetical protein n=1 Tax=Streptomyces shenzhenensis TaxID=943815 RepID=UPI00286828C0|nr:hypothetical protein [Streptomyces shenzhenensis]
MTRRSRLLTTATAGVTAALLLAGCGGGDGDKSKSNDKIAGADTGASASASPSTSASAAASGRPKITLPSDLTYAFEWAKTGNEKKDAVLSDTEQFIKAVDMAIAKQAPLDKAYRFYSEGLAAAGSQKFIQEFVDYKDRITGAKRYFDAKVQINNDGTAGLVYCEDQTKAYNKSLKTGKTEVTKASKDDFVLYNSLLQLNKQGVWITEKLTSQRGSSVCQP